MKKKTKRILIGGLIALFLIGAACAGTFYYYLFYPQFHPSKTAYIYIDKDDTPDSIYNKVKKQGHPKSFSGFPWMTNGVTTIQTSTLDAMPSAQERVFTTSLVVYIEDIKNL